VKLRTYDNLFVRIPNETLLKAQVTTLTRFPIRRIDLAIGVAYKEDLAKVHELLLEVARRDPECLEEPEPLFLLRGYGASSIDIQFSVWVPTARFVARRTALYAAIKEAFDEAGIEIPFPHLSLYAGTATAALPLRLERPPGAAATDGESERQEEA
jgi:small-conductance mechanosensitive channel